MSRIKGLTAIISAGAAVATALEVAREIEAAGETGTVVTILCDGADKYLSESFWEE